MRRDIIDRGIEKGENEMRPVLQSLSDQRPDSGEIVDPLMGRIGPSSGKTRKNASGQSLGTGEDLPERAGISRREQEMHERQVDPKAVRESEKEAELDPAAETEPEEGETAA
jgi:hypothetical protein